jgi:hypothetical protein
MTTGRSGRGHSGADLQYRAVHRVPMTHDHTSANGQWALGSDRHREAGHTLSYCVSGGRVLEVVSGGESGGARQQNLM